MSKLSGRLLLPLAIFVVLLGALIAVSFVFYSSGKTQREIAIRDGRYAKIEIASGMVEGNVTLKGQETAGLPSRPGNPVLAQRQAEPTVDMAPSKPAVEAKPEEPTLPAEKKTEEIPEQPLKAPPAPVAAAAMPAQAPEKAVSSADHGTIPDKQGNQQLIEKVQGLNLPKRDKTSDLRPAEAYHKPFSPTPGNAKIAVVLTGVGMVADQNMQALSLPGNVTLSLSPYAASVNGLREKAQSAGHEIWLDLPMQPHNYPADDAGPLALMTQSAEIENINRLHQAMGAATNYVGLVAPPDEIFSSKSGMKPMAAEIDKRGVELLLQQNTFKDPEGVTYLRKSERALNSDESIEAAKQDLAAAETLAKQSGSAVVTVPATAQMIDLVKEWSGKLAEKKIDLAPLSSFYMPEKKVTAANE